MVYYGIFGGACGEEKCELELELTFWIKNELVMMMGSGVVLRFVR